MPLAIKPTKEQQIRIDQLVANLKTLRAAAGLSQEEMAQHIGMARDSYSGFENCRRKMSWTNYLAIMCVFLNCEATKCMLPAIGLEKPVFTTTESH